MSADTRTVRLVDRVARAAIVTLTLSSGLAGAGPVAPVFRANPPVKVVLAPVASSATGSLTLVNDTAGPVNVTGFVRDATCDAAVTATPAGGGFSFTVAATTSKVVDISCASLQPAGIQRCVFHVLDQNAAPLLDFEAACEYAGATTLTPSASSLAFGTVTIGSTVSMPVSVGNPSATAITRLSFQIDALDGSFKIGSPCNPDGRHCEAAIADLTQGNTASFDVLCSPTSPGTHVAKLYVASNTGQHLPGSPDAIDLTCTGSAAAAPVISVAPTVIDVGAASVLSTTVTAVVYIKNVGAGTLRLTDLRIVDGGNGAAADWRYTASGACAGIIPPACNLTDGQQVELAVSFDPSSIGLRDATLLISYNDTAQRSVSVPLSGLGLGATLDSLGGSQSIDFGTVPVTVTSSLAFQLANRGNRALTAVALGVVPSGPPYTLTPPAMTMVNTTSPTTITAACRPVAAGSFTATFNATAPDIFMSPPIAITATCEGTSSGLYGSPTSLQFGELRTGSSPMQTTITLLSVGAPISITSIALETLHPNLAVVATPPTTTPALVQLTVDPLSDGDLANAIVATTSSGNVIRIPITGKVATATYLPPFPTSLGTFCVGQPTTPGTVELRSTGTAMMRLLAPVLDQGTMSPFDLALVAPSLYPSTIPAGDAATVQITPRRQPSAGVHTDDLVWTTDVAAAPTARTPITATFVDIGSAIAPAALAFGQVPIHIDIKNGQRVTLQNCDTTPVMIESPSIAPPFSIDGPSFPPVLMPNETATISVGFHPTRKGAFSGTLAIQSPQLPELLVVSLSGEGITTGGDAQPDAGTVGPGSDPSSFYACSGCAHGHPAGIILVVVAVVFALVPRRRRERLC